MSDISKHVSMGRIYAACQMFEKLPGSETATAISILLSDAMRDIETLVDSQSTEVAAAVQAEREACAMVALVEATDEAAAKYAVYADWPEAERWQFCEEHDGSALSDRFPLSDWMRERIAAAKGGE